HAGRRAPARTRPQLERLETRCVPHNLALTPLVQVSGPSPFLGNPIEANDPPSTINSAVEAKVAVDPTNADRLVGTWNQDFARGIVASVSFNGGNTWNSVAIPGTTVTTGGTFPHSANAWVSISPNGTAYISLVGAEFPADQNPTGILV